MVKKKEPAPPRHPRKSRTKNEIVTASKIIGQPPKIVQCGDEIIANIADGMSVSHAIIGHIASSTYHEWYNQGHIHINEGVESIYSEFSSKVDAAKAQYIRKLRGIIEDHAPADWKAASWLLERKDPDGFSLKQKVDVTSNGETITKPLFMPSKED